MKESKLAPAVLIAVLCLAVSAYMIFYLLNGFREDLVTAAAFTYTQNVGVEARGVVVREETVLPGTGGYPDLDLAEGEKAAAGDAVALFYSDPSALTTRRSIRELEAEIRQLQSALDAAVQGTADVSALDQQITQAIVNLRSLASSGDLSSLEDAALALQTRVFRRDYTFGDEAAADRLRALIADKQARLEQLERSLGQVSQTVYAPVSGVFSGETDGFESVITPAMLPELTAGELATLLERQSAGDPSAAGKLITSSTWYFAALVPSGSAALQEGKRYTIAFSDGWYGQVEMTLERLETGDEQTLAVFSARSHLSDTTLMRVQTVDLLTDEITGIRIPRRALRVETEKVEQTDPDTGAVSVKEINHYVVYTVVRSQAERQEVEILYTGDTFYLVRPVNEQAADRLRPGDEVILNTAGVFDGKVVR